MHKRSLLTLSIATVACGLSLPIQAQTKNMNMQDQNQTQMQNNQMCLPAACCNDHNGLYITADFIYWKAIEDGFAVAFNRTQTKTLGAVPTSIDNVGTLVRFNPRWAAGFKVGLGWDTCCDGWDVYANWTWYENKPNLNATGYGSATTTGPVNMWGAYDTDQGYSNSALAGVWKLQYNVLDFEMGRDTMICKTLTMRPFFGVEGGWVARTWNTAVTPYALTSTTPVVDFANTTKYWGVGPRFGFDNEWRLGGGWRFSGSLAGSLLYGQIYRNHSYATEVYPTDTEISSVRDAAHRWQVVPHLEAAVGLGWGRCCGSDDKMFFSFDAMWEMHQYWNLLSTVSAANVVTANQHKQSNDLSLAGLTVAFKLAF